MATITTDTFLDGGVARTAGEVWTISNNATLTVRTDSRWHANAPASMTGTIGQITINTPVGGGVFFDGTKVRWIAFSNGTGNVPAINTSITHAGAPGVTGTLLGVWASLTSAPSAVGSAMPSSGFLKFREVTGGSFPSSGAFTGIGADSAGTEGPGWIEVAFDLAVNHSNNPTLGTGYRSEGTWFEIGQTNGSAGQILQAPTNGGGNETRIPAVQVETSPGSGVYEWWNGCFSTPWTTATAGVRPAADGRSRLYQVLDNGQIRFGSDGTTNIGFTPPAGCKVRIPNIFLRAAQTSSRALNSTNFTTITTGVRFSGTGNYDFRNILSDVGFFATGSFNFALRDSCYGGAINCTNNVNSVIIENVAKGDTKASWAESIFNLTGNVGSVDVDGFYAVQYAPGNIFITFNALSRNGVFNNLVYYFIPPIVTNVNPWTVQGSDMVFTNVKLRGATLSLSSTTNVEFYNVDYIERLAGATTTTGSTFVCGFSGSNIKCKLDGLTWGNNQEFANCHPRASGGVITFNSNSEGCVVRNIGSPTNILTTGGTANTRPSRAVQILGGGSIANPNKIQRIFIDNTQNVVVETSDYYSFGYQIEQVLYGTSTSTGSWPIGQSFTVKGLSAPNSVPNSSYNGAQGTWFIDFFNSSTAGRIACLFPPPTSSNISFVETNFTSSISGFTPSGVVLSAVGEYVITETPYFIKGHTGFTNTALTFAGTNQSFMQYQYDINTGSGFSGTWKTINGANLSSETVDPSVGFKLRIKITCVTANSINRTAWIFIGTTTTSVAQLAPLYPLDTSTLTFTGLVPGSEVRCYTGSDPATAVEIGGTESSGSTFSFSHEASGQVGFIRIFALGYQPVNYDPYTYSAADTTLLVQQTVDRNYVNP